MWIMWIRSGHSKYSVYRGCRAVYSDRYVFFSLLRCTAQPQVTFGFWSSFGAWQMYRCKNNVYMSLNFWYFFLFYAFHQKEGFFWTDGLVKSVSRRPWPGKAPLAFLFEVPFCPSSGHIHTLTLMDLIPSRLWQDLYTTANCLQNTCPQTLTHWKALEI